MQHYAEDFIYKDKTIHAM